MEKKKFEKILKFYDRVERRFNRDLSLDEMAFQIKELNKRVIKDENIPYTPTIIDLDSDDEENPAKAHE